MIVFELLLALLIIWYFFYVSRVDDRAIITQLRTMVSEMIRSDKDLLRSCGFHSTVLKYKVRISSINQGTYTEFSNGSVPVINIRLRRDDNSELYNMDTLSYAFIHELAHVICPESGHGKQFDMIENNLLDCARLNGYLSVNSQVDVSYPCHI